MGSPLVPQHRQLSAHKQSRIFELVELFMLFFFFPIPVSGDSFPRPAPPLKQRAGYFT